jgi:hypothetical protein
MVRTKEGGSVLGFVLIGVVLLALFLGGVYFVRQQTANPPEATQPQPVPEEETPAPQPNEEQPQPSEPAPASPDTSAQGHLPQSGPKEAIGTALAISALAGVGLAYVRSRRQITSL